MSASGTAGCPCPKEPPGPETSRRERGRAGVLQGARPRPPTERPGPRMLFPGPGARAASSPPRPLGPRRRRGRSSRRPGSGPRLPEAALTCRWVRRAGEGSGGRLRLEPLDQLTSAVPPSPPTERAPRLGVPPRRPPIAAQEGAPAHELPGAPIILSQSPGIRFLL